MIKTTFDIVKDYLEIFYYLTAGPLLAFLAFKGLSQIKVSREIAKMNAKREAFKISAEQCNVFADKICGLAKKFQEEQKGNKFFDKFKIEITGNNIKTQLVGKLTDEEIKQINESKYFLDLLNSLEGFALYFVSRVASEQVGFVTTGKAYCELVTDLMPLIIDEFSDGYYKNISVLFMTWNNRLTKEKLEFEKKEIERKLTKTPTRQILPIGTE